MTTFVINSCSQLLIGWSARTKECELIKSGHRFGLLAVSNETNVLLQYVLQNSIVSFFSLHSVKKVSDFFITDCKIMDAKLC